MTRGTILSAKKTIIHVGLHKTATTYLQTRVWPRLNSYVLLSRPYTQHNSAFNKLQYADDTLYDKDEVARELARISTDRLLISDESLTGKPVFLSYLNRSLIARRLRELFPEASIVLFVRDQRDIMVSHYNSYIKMPYGLKTFEELFWRPTRCYSYEDYGKRPDDWSFDSLYYNTNDYFIHFDCFRYAPLLDLLNDLFPRVEVILYEDLVADPSSVIERLEDVTGERIDLEEVDTSRRVNRSLNTAELERRRRLNKYRPILKNKYLFHGVARALDALPGRKGRSDLKERAAKMVGDYYVEDNRRLKSTYPALNWGAHADKYDTGSPAD